MMHRIFFAAFLVVTGLFVWACANTEEKPDGALTAVDLAASRQACLEGGIDACRAYAHVVLQSDMSRNDLVAARDELSIYCSEDEPTVCLTVRALTFRIEQPTSDGTFTPHAAPEAPPAVLVASPRRARYAASVDEWATTGRVAALGTVILDVDVRRDGSIYGVRVVKGVDPVLDRITMEVALDNRYLPARDNAQHVDGTFTYRVTWGSAVALTADAGPSPTTAPPSKTDIPAAAQHGGVVSTDAGTPVVAPAPVAAPATTADAGPVQ